MVRDAEGPWGLPDWWDALANELFDDVFICARTATSTALATVAPLVPNSGVLGLAHAALALARNPQVVVLPDALPRPEVLRALVGFPDADVVQLSEESILPARFHRRCLKPLERAVCKGAAGLPPGLRVGRLEG